MVVSEFEEARKLLIEDRYFGIRFRRCDVGFYGNHQLGRAVDISGFFIPKKLLCNRCIVRLMNLCLPKSLGSRPCARGHVTTVLSFKKRNGFFWALLNAWHEFPGLLYRPSYLCQGLKFKYSFLNNKKS